MTPPASRLVLITGATGGIGAALAREYAASGADLLLQGRDPAALDSLARDCRERGACVATQVLDLRDTDALLAWLRTSSAARVPDLVFVNAGVNINIGPDGQGESWADIQNLLEVNVKAAFATVEGVLPSMRAAGRGQIALVSSLAAYRGLALTPSYCASKAALKAYGEGLRDWLAPQGIQVNVIMPGYVQSRMCAGMPGPKPLLWPADKAARAIRRGLARNRPRISFPFPLNLGCWLLSVIHPSVSARILSWLNYRA